MPRRQRIKLTKDNGVYTVDPIDQPGSPVVGRGDTPLEALVFFICGNEEVNLEFIDDTKEVLNEKGVFPNGYNSRQQGR
jgi:hypothetical protein